MTSTGYRRLYRPDHPLVCKNGLVAEHRLVLFDAIGPGTHPCHWCGDDVSWSVGHHGVRRGELAVDHLDGNRRNNNLGNLVPSCHGCNCGRTKKISAGEPHVVRKNGKLARGVEHTCATCGETFVVIVSSAKTGHGKYCSRTCFAIGQQRAVCSQGHARTPENVFSAGGCRECMRAASARHNDRRRIARQKARELRNE